MFLLAQELGLAVFPALVASLCFSLSGFLGGVLWPHFLDSGIWLPLILLFLMRALRAREPRNRLFYASLTGLGLGITILAGGLHVVMMDVIVVVSAAIYHAVQKKPEQPGTKARYSPWFWTAMVMLVTGIFAFASGAIQLLPSMEWSQFSVRWVGGHSGIPTGQKIPYAYMVEMSYRPRALFAFFMPYPFTGKEIGSGEVPIYVGVLPFVLFLIGAWQNWKTAWVRYWTGLAGLTFLYSLGAFSFLHALGYVFFPYLWMAREASRFIYLSHFAIAILAGYGVQTLFSESNRLSESLKHFLRNLKWILVLVAALLVVPALYGKPEVGEWTYFSFLFMLVSYGFVRYTMHGQNQRIAQFLLIAVVLSDWSPTTWMIVNKTQDQKVRPDEYSRLRNCRRLTDYFKSKPGLFRVNMEVARPPSVGDCYGVQTTNGYTASMLADYGEFLTDVPKASDLLNVRYIVKDQPLQGREPIYKDGNWHVYENTSAFPRAWMVHQVVVEPSADKVKQELRDPNFDWLHKAIIRNSLGVELESVTTGMGEEIQWDLYQGDRLELRVKAEGRGLLVLSETYYPGWKATVNGQPAQIHKVDGLLRGVIVPRGESRVVLRYAPLSVLIGAILTLTSFLGTLGFSLYTTLYAKR